MLNIFGENAFNGITHRRKSTLSNQSATNTMANAPMTTASDSRMVFQTFFRLMVMPLSFRLIALPSKKNQPMTHNSSANNPFATAQTPMNHTGDWRNAGGRMVPAQVKRYRYE